MTHDARQPATAAAQTAVPDPVAIVTGGAVRIGAALSRGLARAGYAVCIHYGQSHEAASQLVAEIRARGGVAGSVGADFRRPQDAPQQTVLQAAAALGTPVLLINNAAVFSPDSLATLTAESLQLHLDVNLRAPLFLSQAFVAAVPKQARGHIINVADWRGTRPVPGHLSYTLTKAGIVALTRILAQELGPAIRVNAVAPGAILPPADAPDSAAELAQRNPLKQMGSPADIVRAVQYLLDAEFVTGEILHVTGGEQLGNR